MDEIRLNKSGNRRGMSEGSKNAIKDTNLKNRPKEERKEIARKGAEATNEIISVKKTFQDYAKADADGTMKDKSGKEVPIRQAFIMKLRQMYFNGNLKAGAMYVAMTGEDPAQKFEVTNTTPQIVVATQSDADVLQRIANVKPN